MSLLRAFIAIELSQRTRETIQQQIAPLQQVLGKDLVRWVPLENMHLTLKFLGDVAATHLNFLKQMLSQTAEAHSPFVLQIGGLGAFPSARNPRVLWVGLHAPASLATLQKSIEFGAVRLGYESEERAFSPHLTLGRVRQNANLSDLPKIRAALDKTQLGNIGADKVDALHLFRSDLNPGGSVYTKLFSAPLSK